MQREFLFDGYTWVKHTGSAGRRESEAVSGYAELEQRSQKLLPEIPMVARLPQVTAYVCMALPTMGRFHVRVTVFLMAWCAKYLMVSLPKLC